MSRVMLNIGFVALAFVAQVASHGHLSIPISRDQTLSLRQDQQNPPVTFPLISDFICRNYSAAPSSTWTTLTAGQTAPIQWAMEAQHPGDCFAYLSYDGDNVPDTQKKWFKIASFGNCHLNNVQTMNLTIPSYLPSCDHCVLRWEWYALHLQAIGIVEFYSQCADVKIVGKAGGQLPTPQYTIPGHIPMDANQYRTAVWGYNPTNPVFTGPPVATIGGSSYSCVNTYGSSCIKATPTANPCQISSQRCVNSTAYQACGIGSNTTVWDAPQSCQAGLVCTGFGDGVHIMCTFPSNATTTPPASATPTPSSTTPSAPAPSTPSAPSPSSSCTIGNMKCLTSETYSICNHGSWDVSQSCAAGTTCHPSGQYIYCY